MRGTTHLPALLISLALISAPAFGQTDPQFAIGTGLGTSCQAGQCGIGTGSIQGDVNALGLKSLDVWNTSQQVYSDGTGPLLLIVALPGTTSNAAPPSLTIWGNAGDTKSAGGATLGPAAPIWQGGTGTGYHNGNGWGNWNANGAGNSSSSTNTNKWTGSPNNAGDFLHLPDENSQQYGNWTTIDGQVGVNIGSTQGFDVWVYELTLTSNLSGQSGINVLFSKNLPKGTLIFAEGCISFADCSGSSNLFFTPFTTDGVVTGVPSVPEPASLILMGTFLLSATMLLPGRNRTERTRN